MEEVSSFLMDDININRFTLKWNNAVENVFMLKNLLMSIGSESSPSSLPQFPVNNYIFRWQSGDSIISNWHSLVAKDNK